MVAPLQYGLAVPEFVTADMFTGLAITGVLTILSSVGASVLAVVWASARRSPRRRERFIGTVFVELFRNIPALILLLIFAFAVPNAFDPDLRSTLFFDNPVMNGVGDALRLPIPYYALGAVAALSLNTGAHLAEILRSAMAAIPRGRVEIARTLGASRLGVLRTVVVPDALRVGMPAIKNRMVHNLKNTALASFVAVPEFFGRVRGAINETFAATELLVFAAVVYLALAALLGGSLDWAHRRLLRGVPEELVGHG